MNLQAYDFSLFVFALAANLGLIFVVMRFAPRNQSRSLFILLGVEQVIWFMVNYFAIKSGPDDILNLARWTIAAAAPHPILFYLFIYSFLRKKDVITPTQVALSIFGAASIIILARSPYLFTHVETVGGQSVPVAGPGMAIFGLYSLVLIIMSLFHLLKSWRRAEGVEKIQWRFIGIGLFVMIGLILFFNFLLAVVSENLNFVNFGHIYTLPFVVFTTYAIIRHNLLNIKGILAEVMVILLNLIIFVQLVGSSSTEEFLINGLVQLFAVVIGYLLVISVIKEVETRQKMEELSDQLSMANDQLQVLDKARAEFISIASHQLRTPPATIKWYLAAILAGDYGKVTPKVKAAIEKSEASNNGLIALIGDMLNASRIERGKMEFLFEPADFLKLVGDAVQGLEPQSRMKKLKLNYKRPAGTYPQILADKEKLQQVVNNLIDNALKYTKTGSVSVSVSKTATDIVLKVKDTGKGLTPGEPKSIFEKYGRGVDSQKHSSGLGLGLYVAKVIVDHHKGKISAESAGPGKGTTFIVSLPIKTNLKAETFDLTKTQTA